MNLLEKMVAAVEKVRQRLSRASIALEQQGIPYAVVGGNAVAAWVASVDEAAVRNTQDVDILLKRSDLPAAREALGEIGFLFRHALGIDMFLDGPEAKARDAVHIIYAGEKIRPEYPTPAPEVEAAQRLGELSVVNLLSLVVMKLTSFRDKDRMHLRDLIGVGLIDSTWLGSSSGRLPQVLAERLKSILDDPEG